MSTASPFPLFGRAWALSVNDSGGNNLLSVDSLLPNSGVSDPRALHIQFDVYQTIRAAYWYADIVIWNLNSPTEQSLIKQGYSVQLEAGYEGFGQYGVIFEGICFQPLYERVNGTDYKLTLHCVVGLVENSANFVNQTLSNGLSQRDIVAQMASACRFPLDTSNVSSLGPIKQSRASTYFGNPGDYFENIAADAGQTSWFTSKALNIQKYTQDTSVPTLTYGPGTGLIGTPQQTQDGVQIKVLLDPRAELRTQIQLSITTAIAQYPKALPSFPTILDANGLYVIGAVRHYGDSRGNDWYSEITGFVYAGSVLALSTAFQ